MKLIFLRDVDVDPSTVDTPVEPRVQAPETPAHEVGIPALEGPGPVPAAPAPGGPAPAEGIDEQRLRILEQLLSRRGQEATIIWVGFPL